MSSDARERVEEFHNRLNKVERRINALNEKFNYYLDLAMKEYKESPDMYSEMIKKIEEINLQLDRVKRKWGRLIHGYYGIPVNEIVISYLSYLIIDKKINFKDPIIQSIRESISKEELHRLDLIGNYLKDYSELKTDM